MTSARRLIVLMPVLALLPMSGWAENEWSIPEACYAQSVLDRACAAKAAEDEELRLQATVDRIAKSLRADVRASRPKGDESSDPEWEQKRLRRFSDLQRAWHAYRDAVCNAAVYEYHGGSLSQPMEYACRLETAAAYREQLQAIYHAELQEQ